MSETDLLKKIVGNVCYILTSKPYSCSLKELKECLKKRLPEVSDEKLKEGILYMIFKEIIGDDGGGKYCLRRNVDLSEVGE